MRHCPVCHVIHSGHELPINEDGIYEEDGSCIFLGSFSDCYERIQYIARHEPVYVESLVIRSVA